MDSYTESYLNREHEGKPERGKRETKQEKEGRNEDLAGRGERGGERERER